MSGNSVRVQTDERRVSSHLKGYLFYFLRLGTFGFGGNDCDALYFF